MGLFSFLFFLSRNSIIKKSLKCLSQVYVYMRDQELRSKIVILQKNTWNHHPLIEQPQE
jgi:hypothetical protein